MTEAGVIYVGDPMCSWCWGMSPAIAQLQRHCVRVGLPFSIVTGGLRAGGGDAWDKKFRTFLREHWQEIGDRTGQPFRFRLLDRDHFNYDTEPACRAIVVARGLLQGGDADGSRIFSFFQSVQEKFYVVNEDPGAPEFYRDLCKRVGLDYARFRTCFEGEDATMRAREDFALSKSWAVRGFPSVVFRHGSEHNITAYGYVSAEELIAGVENLRK